MFRCFLSCENGVTRVTSECFHVCVMSADGGRKFVLVYLIKRLL